ncbi:MAG: DUF2269 family protein [Chloroflexi bacterium]|nr:DUF2269 family protein [Chloroflexota bacterium]
MASEYYEFFHIVFVLIFFSGTIVAMLAERNARNESNIHTVRSLVGMVHHSWMYLVNLPLVLTGIFGALTAWQLELPLTDTGWLNAAYGAIIVSVALALAVTFGHSRRVLRLAERDAQQGAKSPELQALLSSPAPRIATPVLHAIVAYIIVLMVFKPF